MDTVPYYIGVDHLNSKDVAKIAGVSRTTVSRVINNSDNVSEETRKKVLDVINKNNYVPDASARKLAGIKSRTIGLFIVDIRAESGTSKEGRVTFSPYYSNFTGSIIDNAAKLGYKVLVDLVSSMNMYEEVKQVFYDKTIVGGIFIGQGNDDPVIEEIINSGYKVALVDQSLNSHKAIFKKCLIVNSDNYIGAYEAVKYLIKLNHKNIAHITGDMEKFSSVERLQGYKQALTDYNIPIQNNLIVKGAFLESSGYNLTKKLILKQKPTAIFLGDDIMAIGAMKAIKELGLRTPEDISIIGFDDIEIARHLTPALTTLRMKIPEMASIVVNTLITSIDSDLDFSASYTVPVELIERESCSKLK